MSDAKLRELERRWRETGAVDDEAAYLLERVRVGNLPRERLELAAYCGHAGARGALGSAVPQAPESLPDFVASLVRWGVHTVARALLAVVEAAAPVIQAEAPYPVPTEAQTSAAAWVECPCDAHLRELREDFVSLGPEAAYDTARRANEGAPNPPQLARVDHCMKAEYQALSGIYFAGADRTHERLVLLARKAVESLQLARILTIDQMRARLSAAAVGRALQPQAE